VQDDAIRSLYESSAYPAVSYPACDPAVMAVAAKLAGLSTPPPSCARILEIGCSSGHHLLHLAERWPESRFTGIDISGAAIRDARETAAAAGLTNVEFIATSLADFVPDEECYDYIIAHGFYSWVPHDVRDALLRITPILLDGSGVAAIGYNTLPGWGMRRPVGNMLRDLRDHAPPEVAAREPMELLSWLEDACPSDTYGNHLRAILAEMRAQGSAMLSFDDLAPVNEPCTFADFLTHATASGLRYLGESDIAKNIPSNLPDAAMARLAPLAGDPFLFQQTLDLVSGRSHRVSLLCMAGAPVEGRITTATALHFAFRSLLEVRRDGSGAVLCGPGGALAKINHPLAISFFGALASFAPQCVTMREVLEVMSERLGAAFDPTHSLPPLAGLVMDAARRGLVLPRIDPVRFDPTPPAYPKLSPLRLLSARRKRSLVDIYHAPRVFPEVQYDILAAMDGTRSAEQLRSIAAAQCPDLDFAPWLALLAARGMFAVF
jgi:SAM-dependent methyltransferase